MLQSFFLEVTKAEPRLQKCDEGVAFLKAALSLYGLSSVSYVAINIPKKGNQFLHCAYSNSAIRQKTTLAPLSVDGLRDLGLLQTSPVDWTASERLKIELKLRTPDGSQEVDERRAASFALSTLRGETAVFAAAIPEASANGDFLTSSVMTELRILGKYFHSHILRLNGHDTFDSLLISARELDCLKWTAAGKTAWEASRILGISERTVIFHLNAARKKLNCATTTQAVAKAVATQLISL
ncbi:LuxR C-terminal-related transcriptional regulator [Hyphomicrobium sp. CS1GBMeth3]|uniref:helix-turn-helix transcriptional regulator n=1 Tax=Hyphomicrobium sp. CS1GBMeth3 TaxID=1892845 RepID=UPI000931588F|nr:LuxR C-terminal-related transcriptional regulator [Hyphomicrobium sp. CS1GBMeth3]